MQQKIKQQAEPQEQPRGDTTRRAQNDMYRAYSLTKKKNGEKGTVNPTNGVNKDGNEQGMETRTDGDGSSNVVNPANLTLKMQSVVACAAAASTTTVDHCLVDDNGNNPANLSHEMARIAARRLLSMFTIINSQERLKFWALTANVEYFR